jgi:hypothetical protein
MESQADDTYSSFSKGPGPFVFVIAFSDPRAIEPAALAGKGRHSIVVQIEPEDAFFTLSLMDPARATRTFAEAIAKQTAFLAIEKEFPNGVEPSLSAEQIDHIPAEFENRLPDLCVNGSTEWLVAPRISNAELSLCTQASEPRGRITGVVSGKGRIPVGTNFLLTVSPRI